jgi:hypothetical protein
MDNSTQSQPSSHKDVDPAVFTLLFCDTKFKLLSNMDRVTLLNAETATCTHYVIFCKSEVLRFRAVKRYAFCTTEVIIGNYCIGFRRFRANGLVRMEGKLPSSKTIGSFPDERRTCMCS